MPTNAQPHDLLDKAIAITIVLFILSMISERFVTWIKLYYGKAGKSLWLFSNKEEDITLKKQNPAQEKLREQKILGLTIVLSILIALLAHANLFKLLSSDPPYNAIGWAGVDITKINLPNDLLKIFNSIFGCILTGFFISLGSKFWHDLLDLLLYSKNLKQKLSDPGTYAATSADQLTEYLSFSESDLVRLAIEQNGQTLKAKFPNIQYLNDSIAILNGERKDVLGIYVKDKNTNGFPDNVPVKLPSGKIYNVKTEIISGIGISRVSGGMDGSVANTNLSGYSGSGCCIVIDSSGQNYLLTNCHVMTGGFFQSPFLSTGQPDVNYENNKIGVWQFGLMSAMGDFALATIDDINSFISNNNPELFNNQLREIKREDWLHAQVTVRGNKTKTRTGAFIIEVIQNQAQIKYDDGSILTLNKAILLGDRPDKLSCSPVTDFMDSGGAVYDDNLNLIGIIVSIDNRFSYAIPLADFINNQNLTIK